MKPIAAFGLALVAMFAIGCSSVATQQATRQLATEAEPNAVTATEAEADAAATSHDSTDQQRAQGQETTEDSALDTGSTSVDERGGRDLGSQPAGVETETPTASTEPADTSQLPVTPDAAGAAEATPEPTPVSTPSPTATPVPVFISPTPGPVPSDNVVIEGPDVDESEAVSISDNGALACSLTERAIEFLDFGDANRTAAALQEASEFATQASEPEIAGTAPGLAGAGTNEESALAAIIDTLNACAIHGYQV